MAIEHDAIVDGERHEPKGIATASAGAVYEANGTGSGAWTVGSKIVIINSVADFPAPTLIGGISTIKLEAKEYLINQSFSMTTPLAWPGAGTRCEIRAINRAVVTYTGTDSMFKDPAAEGQIEIDGLTQWEAPNGNMWDVTAGAGGFGFQAKAGPKFTNCNGLGTLNGGGNSTTSMFFGTLSNFDTGLTANNMSFFEVNTMFVFGNNIAGNTYFTVQGASTKGSINFILNTYISDTNTTLWDINTNIQSTVDSVNFRGNQEEGGLNGTTFKAGSLTEKSNKVLSVGNQVIGDTVPGGLLSMNNNATATTITATSTDGTNAVLVAGTWVIEDTSQFTGTTAGRLTYNDVRNITTNVEVIASIDPASDATLAFYISKNGSPIVQTGVPQFVKSADNGVMSTMWKLTMATTDFLEIYIENQSNTSNVTVTDILFRIP